MRRVVIDLASTRPVWRVPPETIAAARRAFGRGFEVVAIKAPTISDSDGGGGSPEAVEAARGAEVYVGYGVPRGVAEASKGTLQWAHTAAAGVGGTLTPEFRATRAVLTNSRGVYAEPMADWAIAAMGFCLRGFHASVAAQRRAQWAKDQFTDGTVRPRELAGARVGLIGLGGIGSAIARRCVALGMDVRAIRRRPRLRRPRGMRWVGGSGDLLTLARTSDVLVITAPDTQATRALVTGEVLSALPAGAFVINLARGRLLDEAALLRQLESGHLAGCVLDVFSTEPLPPTHAFWTHPGVFVSPHVSAVSDRIWERQTELLVENARRYRKGRPLLNRVDLEAGY